MLDVNLAECDFMNPTFSPPTIGSPTLFTHESFNFYGITDTYKRDRSSSGNPTYSVALTNGNFILGGVELILNDYYGSVNSVPNLINLFGYLENTGGFGYSGVNSAGMSWADIANTLVTICNNISGGTYGSPITYKGYKYKIDLSALIALVVPTYYRINNDSINLLDFISDICSAGGHDYFVRLNEPSAGEVSAGWSGTFEIVTMSRIEEPVPGRVDDFIESATCVVSKNYGQEVRKDVHSKFVVGANIERMYFNTPVDASGDNSYELDASGNYEISIEEFSNDTVLPFFGVDVDNNVIVGYRPSGEPTEYYFNIDVSDMSLPVATGEYLTCLGELRAARKGRSNWENYLCKRDLNEYIIEPLGTGTAGFKTDFVINSDFAVGGSSGIYYLPKYGWQEAVHLKGTGFADTIYPGVKYNTYPHNSNTNYYYHRASKLNITSAFRLSFPRMMESDLREKSLTDAVMLKIYESFKLNQMVGQNESQILAGSESKKASKVEDESLGSFNDNKTDQLYRRIKGIADTYYNKKFMVSIPFTLGAYEPESSNIRMSQEIASDGFIDESAWSTAYSSGLIPDISGINTILSPDNKFYPFVKYENCVILDSGGNVTDMLWDFSEIGQGDKIFGTPVLSTGGVIPSGSNVYDCWVKCSVDEKIYFQDSQTLYGPRAVIELPGSVKLNLSNTGRYPSYAQALYDSHALATGVSGVFYQDPLVTEAFLKASFDKIGSDEVQAHDGENLVYANLYAIPLRSKLLSYGPWYAVGASGKVSYERNQELNPWNYGGFDALNQAGWARVTEGITNQTFSEAGSITMIGAPTFNFGDVLISGGPYITDISCSFGTQGVTTTYNFQAWSSHRTLSKLNGYAIERNNRLTKNLKEIKSNYREGLKNGRFKNAGDFYNKVSNRFIDLNDYTRKDRSNTSHAMFAGQVNGIGATVVSQPYYNAGAQSYSNFGDKAYMSADGLMRPFSTVAKSGWPNFELPTSSGSGLINSLTLNPFDSGNDITALAYGTGQSPDLLTGLLRGTGEIPSSGEFVVPYRALGLRLPAVGVGWGYDLNGLPVPSGTGVNGFREDYLYNMEHWKAGPIDLRWDEGKKIWSSNPTIIYLSKVTNTYNPTSFSYEVERSNSRDQFTRLAPIIAGSFNPSAAIYDPEYIAYTGNPSNTGTYEQLDYSDLEYPYYEAFIIRDTSTEVGNPYYDIWTDDCQDCGHVSNPCGFGGHGTSSVGKKILIENPLRQSLDAGDLAFTVKTGRSKYINTGSFVGGSGVGASGHISTNSSGVASFVIDSPGSGYVYGGFGLASGVCASLSLTFAGGIMTTGYVSPSGGFKYSQTYPVTIYPTNAAVSTERLEIHWIMQAEFKTQQVVTHVACDGGLLQTCSVKIQTQGFKSCSYCGEDSALVNSF